MTSTTPPWRQEDATALLVLADGTIIEGRGLGAAGTAVVGMLALGETVSTLKLVSIGLVVAGAVGLNLAGANP